MNAKIFVALIFSAGLAGCTTPSSDGAYWRPGNPKFTTGLNAPTLVHPAHAR